MLHVNLICVGLNCNIALKKFQNKNVDIHTFHAIIAMDSSGIPNVEISRLFVIAFQ